MDIPQAAEIVEFLNSKGFHLEESSPTQLRFERQVGDKYSEIEIQISPTSMPVKMKLNDSLRVYNTSSFGELKSLLKDEIDK